jgi:hypothetical protein
MTRRSGHGPGYAPLSAIAAHWRVSADTARKLIGATDVQTIRRRGRCFVAWRDVWALEGARDVPEDLWSAYKASMLTRTDLQEHYGLSARTARRWLENGELPTIRLSDRIVRVRPVDVDGADELAEAA